MERATFGWDPGVWGANDEVEIFFAVLGVVVDRMVDAEGNLVLLHMATKERRVIEQIEDDPPAGNLAVVITAWVIVQRERK
jgi:hypothetical protein